MWRHIYTCFCSIISKYSLYNFILIHCWVFLFLSTYFFFKGWIEIIINNGIHWVHLKMHSNELCQSGNIWSRGDNNGGCVLLNFKPLNQIGLTLEDTKVTPKIPKLKYDVSHWRWHTNMRGWCLLERSKDALVGLIN